MTVTLYLHVTGEKVLVLLPRKFTCSCGVREDFMQIFKVFFFMLYKCTLFT